MPDRIILTVAILGGTGKLGPGLALRWANAGYRVIVGSRQEEKAQRIAQELNDELGTATITGMQNLDAVKSADICVLTVLHTAHQEAVESLKGALEGKILVDTTSRVDFRDPKPPTPPSAPEFAQETLGSGTPVVAAFQTVPAHSLRQLGMDLDQDVMVCSDDPEAAEEVIKLAKAAGLTGYYAGTLENAIVLEGITALIISMNQHYKSKRGAVQITGIHP